MTHVRRCFIMLCSDRTENECLERGLFGDTERAFRFNLGEIQAGDLGFLLNYSTDELIGVFQAVSEAQVKIEPDAWGGMFPAQVRVRCLGRPQRIRDAAAALQRLGLKMRPLKSGGSAPEYVVYSEPIVDRLLAHFHDVPVEHARPVPPMATSMRGRVTFQDVVGLEDVKDFIRRRMIEPIRDLERAQEYYLRLVLQR